MGRRPFVAEKVLETAFTLFARDGFEAVSSRMLAEEAGIGSASLFRHFPTMEALGREVYARALGPWLDEIDALWQESTDPLLRLRGITRQLYAGYDTRPKALALLVFPPHLFTPEQLDVANPRSHRARCKTLCRGDEDRAALLWGALTGALQDRFLRQREGAMSRRADHVADLASRLLPG